MSYTFSWIECINGFLLAMMIVFGILFAIAIKAVIEQGDKRVVSHAATAFMMFASFTVAFFGWNQGWSKTENKEFTQDLPKPPNYDKEALLDLMEQGECMGGTIDDGKFSIFVCKEEIKND